LDQNFRDESANVVKRAQKSYQKAKCGASLTKLCAVRETEIKNSPQTDSISFATLNFEVQQDSTTFSPYLSYDLSQAIEEVALTHFMSSFIPGSRFDYLPWMYDQPIYNVGIALPATIHAASMALLAQELRHPEVLTMARNAYAIALLETNTALAEPTAATQDATLISILLLSLFEAIVWTCPRTPNSWNTHTRGALALINLRGPHQFHTPRGRKLFFQVATTICVESLQQKTALPPGLTALIQQIATDYTDEAPHYHLTSLTAKVSQLRVDIAADAFTPEEVVHATRSLDEEYIVFGHNFPLAWKFETIVLEESIPDVYGKTLHSYPNHRIAQLWNSCRMTRILLNEAIRAYASWLPPSAKIPIQATAVANIQHMSEQICASIPQFTMTCPGLANAQCISTRAAAASLLWPLSAIKSASLASEEVRAYAVERLRFIGREARVEQVERVVQERGEFDALQNGLHMLFLS
jgi:hypothetical protein